MAARDQLGAVHQQQRAVAAVGLDVAAVTTVCRTTDQGGLVPRKLDAPVQQTSLVRESTSYGQMFQVELPGGVIEPGQPALHPVPNRGRISWHSAYQGT